MTDQKTLDVYDAKIEEYKSLTAAQPSNALKLFIAGLPKGGDALDLGCGPGFAAAEMARNGLNTFATDASPEMAKAASEHEGVHATCETFDALPETPKFDGIYANFSLLHTTRAEFPTYVKKCHEALRPGGLFHLGMKLGSGEERDDLGRRYCYFSETEFESILNNAGFKVEWKRTGEEKGLAGSTDPFILIQSRA